LKNKRHGHGVFYYPDGSKYDGEWNENLREGHGIYTYPNNDTYEGEWKNHQRDGRGTYTYAATKAKYIGTWNSGKRQGPGEMEFGQYRYVGKFHENYPKGKGKFVFQNGYQQNGEYHITSTTTDDDSDVPPQVQYKWIARDVTAVEQEQSYDVDEEQAEIARTQDQDTLQNANIIPDDTNPETQAGDTIDENQENQENPEVNDEIPGEEQFDDET